MIRDSGQRFLLFMAILGLALAMTVLGLVLWTILY